MKKIISVLMCISLVVGCMLVGCTKQDTIKSDIVLITNGDTVADGGYNQSAWEGVSQYAQDNALSCRYYQPVLDENDALSVENVEKYVDLSVNNGAQYIVLSGEDFASIAYEIAPQYPDVNFLLLGAIPHAAGDTTDRFINNVMSVTFDALQSGFLAGYIAVVNGNTELGFFGENGSNTSSTYGAGFVQGAAYAADSLGIPVTVDWSEYDSSLLDYSYDVTVTACYEKVEEDDRVVKVENGIGSGTYAEGSNVTITANPAPLGQTFDHWEVKSDTDGIKDKKVNISSSTKSTMNLLIEKCDCTITAVYKDIEGANYPVTVLNVDGSEYSVQSVSENSSCEVTAPVAGDGLVFDHWESSIPDAVESPTEKTTKVNVTDAEISLTPVYVTSSTPTFKLTVETGEGANGESTGSGAYLAGDTVNIAAAVPNEGYKFSHWENKDASGNGAGIAMENEYYANTSFEMVDRYAALCEEMYNHGVTAIFTGGNDMMDSAFTAKNNYDFDLNVIAAGAPVKDSYFTLVNDYRVATINALGDFKGGSVLIANCSNEGLYSTFVSKDKNVESDFDTLYKLIGEGKISMIPTAGHSGYEFCEYFAKEKPSKCLTLKGQFLEGSKLTK